MHAERTLFGSNLGELKYATSDLMARSVLQRRRKKSTRFLISQRFKMTVGNMLIIAAVITTRRLRTVTNCFVLSLAIADWLVGFFVMPLAVTKHLNKGKWILGQGLCIIWVFCDVCVCTASILSLCAISIDRYFAVTQPLNYSRRRRSKRLAALMILFVWMAAIVITCPPMIW
ncbi:hypothetical protein J6590_004704 [Homalodisca vitripennis]|nr:hypothetical protein J6590_004704 [Homalodisca vitripennis]